MTVLNFALAVAAVNRQPETDYRELPLFRHGQATQAEAAAKIAPHTARLQQTVLDCVRARGGATNEEITHATGIKTSSVCGRVNELVKAGKLKDSGERRACASGVKAKVWVLV